MNILKVVTSVAAICVLISSIALYSQDSARNRIQVEAVEQDTARLATVYIGKRNAGPNAATAKRDLLGVGFLVEHNEHLILLTVKHVAETIEVSHELGFQFQADIPNWVAVGDVNPQGAKSNWKFSGEIAVLPILANERLSCVDELRQIALSTNEFRVSRPTQGETVDVFGFPLGFGVNESGKVSPVMQRTTVAHNDIEMPAQWNLGNCVLLFPSTMSGSSGGPAILKGERVPFVGLCTGALSDARGDKATIIIPADRILSFLQRSLKTGEGDTTK